MRALEFQCPLKFRCQTREIEKKQLKKNLQGKKQNSAVAFMIVHATAKLRFESPFVFCYFFPSFPEV